MSALDVSALDVPDDVIEVVKAWVMAPSLEEGHEALRAGRLSLDAALQATLVNEVAVITSETMVECIAMEKGLDAPADPIQVPLDDEGEKTLPMHPKQVERLSAWALELEPTASALGLDNEQFLKRLRGAMETLEGDEVAAVSIDKAKQLLGQSGEAFENRPELGTSKQAGLAGRLAALQFQNKD